MEKSIMKHVVSCLRRTWPPFLASNLRLLCLTKDQLPISKFNSLIDRTKNALRGTPASEKVAYIMKCLVFSAFAYGISGETQYEIFMTVLDKLAMDVSGARKSRSTICGDVDDAIKELERSFDGESEAKKLASHLVTSIALGSASLSEDRQRNDRIVYKLVTMFQIGTGHLKQAISDPDKFEELERGVEQIIWRFASNNKGKTRTKVMLESFPLKNSTSRDFLASMVRENELEAAEYLATLLGQTMICFLVQQCINQKKDERMLKKAHKIAKHYKLELDFPDVIIQYRELLLMKDLEKGHLDRALLNAREYPELTCRLLERAREIGYEEKQVLTDCLRLEDLVSKDNVIWIDTRDGLDEATKKFAGVEMVGIDSEWMIKGFSEKVAILQIATDKSVLIFDMIKLYEIESEELNDCLKPVFRSPDVLKLGYSVKNDLHKLFRCYGDLECFQKYEGILDLQRLFAIVKGGLSGLAKDKLGAPLDKTSQMTDWAQRPLDNSVLDYAALDAAVLIAIFHKTCIDSDKTYDWKSQIQCWEPTHRDHRLLSEYDNVNDILKLTDTKREYQNVNDILKLTDTRELKQDPGLRVEPT